MGESGEQLFEEARDAIESALRFVAFRRRLAPTEFQELRSFVMLELVENDLGVALLEPRESPIFSVI